MITRHTHKRCREEGKKEGHLHEEEVRVAKELEKDVAKIVEELVLGGAGVLHTREGGGPSQTRREE